MYQEGKTEKFLTRRQGIIDRHSRGTKRERNLVLRARVLSRRYLTIPRGIEGTSRRAVDIACGSVESIHFKRPCVIDPETKCYEQVANGDDDILVVRGCALTILRSTCWTMFVTMQQQTFYPSIDHTKSFACQRSFRAAATATVCY